MIMMASHRRYPESPKHDTSPGSTLGTASTDHSFAPDQSTAASDTLPTAGPLCGSLSMGKLWVCLATAVTIVSVQRARPASVLLSSRGSLFGCSIAAASVVSSL